MADRPLTVAQLAAELDSYVTPAHVAGLNRMLEDPTNLAAPSLSEPHSADEWAAMTPEARAFHASRRLRGILFDEIVTHRGVVLTRAECDDLRRRELPG